MAAPALQRELKLKRVASWHQRQVMATDVHLVAVEYLAVAWTLGRPFASEVRLEGKEA